jgi:hypothetical protein
MPTGGIPEIFDTEYQRDEGCSEADWAWVNLHLWRLTGETRYLDAADLVINTHMAATQFSNGGFGHGVFLPLQHDNKSWRWGKIGNYASDSYWCCSMHATQLLADRFHWGVLRQGDNLLVTWISDVVATFNMPNGEASIGVEQTMPDVWRIEITGVPAGKTLRLRVPEPSEGLLVNGKFVAGKEWIDLPLPEEASATIVVIPQAIHLLAPYAGEVSTEKCPVRIFVGSYMYCLPEVILPEDARNQGEVPTVMLPESASDVFALPAIIKCRETLVSTKLRPVTTRWEKILLFNVEQVSDEAFVELRQEAQPAREPGQFITFAFANDGPYDVYLNGEAIFHHAGWEESPYVDVEVQPGRNTLAVKTPAKSDKPGVIGFIRDATDAVTTPDWQAFPTGDIPTPELLTGDSTEGTVPLEDRGGFGAAPWNHVPAHFAGTDARWIWPQGETDQPSWLFRYSWEK